MNEACQLGDPTLYQQPAGTFITLPLAGNHAVLPGGNIYNLHHRPPVGGQVTSPGPKVPAGELQFLVVHLRQAAGTFIALVPPQGKPGNHAVPEATHPLLQPGFKLLVTHRVSAPDSAGGKGGWWQKSHANKTNRKICFLFWFLYWCCRFCCCC